VFDYTKKREEIVPDPVDPIRPPMPPVFILRRGVQEPVRAIAKAMPMKLNADQELAMGVWDAAPAGKGKAVIKPVIKGPTAPTHGVKGSSGFSCKADANGKRPECGANQCCGTAKKVGMVAGIEICHTKAAITYTDQSKIQMTFKCGAERLVAFATAILAYVYLI